jgi:hypothetical protein
MAVAPQRLILVAWTYFALVALAQHHGTQYHAPRDNPQRDIQSYQCGREWLYSPLLQVDFVCPVFDSVSDRNETDLNFAPWTHRPYCIDADYCLYTNSRLHGRYGISVISSSQIMARSVEIFRRAFATPYLHSKAAEGTTPDLAYDVRQVSGKGNGAIARRNIRQGEIFIVDYASVMVVDSFPRRVPGGEKERLLQRAITQLPDPGRVMSLSRRGVPGLSPVEDIFRTNSHATKLDGTPYIALFPEIAVGKTKIAATHSRAVDC